MSGLQVNQQSHILWKEKGFDSSEIQGLGWPVDFAKDIENTFIKLNIEYKELVNLLTKGSLY